MAPAFVTIYVMDLAEAHGMALNHLFERQTSNPLTLNIGTGRGLNVLDVVVIRTCHWCDHPLRVCRTGDVPRSEACPQKAQTLLGWKARRNLEDMCRDGWAWQQANPMGYQRKA